MIEIPYKKFFRLPGGLFGGRFIIDNREICRYDWNGDYKDDTLGIIFTFENTEDELAFRLRYGV
jgi:hypothetical protein